MARGPCVLPRRLKLGPAIASIVIGALLNASPFFWYRAPVSQVLDAPGIAVARLFARSDVITTLTWVPYALGGTAAWSALVFCLYLGARLLCVGTQPPKHQ